MEGLSPVVQVVTVSDWPAIVTGIITGIVGLAGIGGTLWSGKRSINAEKAHSQREEKKQVYASCMAAFSNASMLIAKRHTHEEFGGGPEKPPLTDEYAEAISALLAKVTEVQLIAPLNISSIADRAYSLTLASNKDLDKFNESREARKELIMAMRADLGESV